jgi:hypothetical protein
VVRNGEPEGPQPWVSGIGLEGAGALQVVVLVGGASGASPNLYS